MESCVKKIRELFAIDIRSLALFRIGLALILIGDLFVRIQDLQAHYSDEGILPRSILMDNLLGVWDLSLHVINGTWQIQLCLFILALFFGIALLIGYKTRLATIASWILLISLHTRNPMVLQGGDILLRLLLFWSLFLPLGAYWSIDQKISKKPPLNTQVFSMATVAILLQVAFMYWFTSLLKSDESWRQSGHAIWYSLSIEQYSTQLGIFLLQFPNLLKVLTFATFYLEAFGPFFAFSPIWTGPLRMVTLLLFTLFHLVGLNLTMELAHFSYVCAVAWIIFIPKWFWNKVLHSNKLQDTNREASSNITTNLIATFFLGLIFFWNIHTINSKPLPSFVVAIGSLFRIDQYWNMFAPGPLKEDGWYVIPAFLRDGTQVDLYTGGKPVSFEKPKLLSSTYPNDRWRSYLMNMFLDGQKSVYLSHYASYLTNQWNQSHPFEKQAITFEIIYMWKLNDIKNPATKHKKIILWHHYCFDGPEEKMKELQF